MHEPKNKLNIDYVRREALNRWGFVLIDLVYVNNAHKMAWLDTATGKTFTRSWSKLISGKVGATNVNNYEKDKNFFESYKGLGYKLDMTRDEYLSAPTQSGNKLFHLTHVDLEEPWDVKKGHFKLLAETHLNNSGKSTGELFIESLLKTNNVKFEEQKKAYINSNLNLFDFYLPEYNLYIEYDGKQHFLPIKQGGGEEGLKHRKLKDLEKDTYVKNTGAKILRIPYTVSNIEDIAKAVQDRLNIPIVVKKVKLSGLKAEVVKYYETHSAKETSAKFNICNGTISRYYKQSMGHAKYRGRK